MTIFTIDNENGITAFATAAAAADASTTPFDLVTDQQELAELLASWPAERWVATFNSLPGVKPVKALKDSKTAASKIWECVEKLGRMVAPEPVAAKPEAAPANPKRGKKAKAGLAFESPRAQQLFSKTYTHIPTPNAPLGHKLGTNFCAQDRSSTPVYWSRFRLSRPGSIRARNGQIPWQTRANWRP